MACNGNTPFYLTDESQFVATFGPSHNTGGYSHQEVLPMPLKAGDDAGTVATSTSSFNPRQQYRGRSGQSLTPPRTRMVNNVRSGASQSPKRSAVSGSGSYFDGICMSQSVDDDKEHPQTVIPPTRSVMDKSVAESSTQKSDNTPTDEANCNFQMPWQTLAASSEPAPPPKPHLPVVTAAARPFQNMIPPSGYLYDELLKDAAYQHALRAGLLWQSLTSQHVHFPSLWYDGEEPERPPMGCLKKVLSKKHHSKWHYYGRHRVAGSEQLMNLIGNRGSSGRLLLHLMVLSSGSIVSDVVVGCFHPNARGIRLQLTYDPSMEHCRDVWIGVRQRTVDHATTNIQPIEALLQHYNKGFVESTPLGGAGSKQQDLLKIDNANLKAVFGARPPLFTLMVPEDELAGLLSQHVRTNVPASIVLMRQYLKDAAM